MSSPILGSAARLFLPVSLLFSIFLLVRGHQAPGGGFAGGLVAASSVALFAAAFGVRAARRILPVPPERLAGAGLGLALAAALAGPLAGAGLLEGLWAFPELGGLGTVPLGTPLLFDAGVYLLVVGASTSIFLSLAQEEG